MTTRTTIAILHSPGCVTVWIAHPLLKADGAIFVSIDKTERTILEHALDDVFGSGKPH